MSPFTYNLRPLIFEMWKHLEKHLEYFDMQEILETINCVTSLQWQRQFSSTDVTGLYSNINIICI